MAGYSPIMRFMRTTLPESEREMQYNNTVSLVLNTLGDFAEETESSRADLKCCILYQRKVSRKEDKGRDKNYDLKMILPAKSYAPYSDILTKNLATFEFEGVKYVPEVISAIKDFSGKTKYLEIEAKEVKDGN